MKKVLLAQQIDSGALALLKENAEVVLIKEGSMEDFREQLEDTYAVVLGTSIKFTRELMDSAPQLKVISRTGAGVDNVDLKAATEKGILVLNTPEANSRSVAEHALTLMCALAKHVVFLDDQVRKDNFKARRLNLPVDMDGKTLGLVGCGRIGLMVAKKCINAFDMKVIGYDPFVKTAPEGVELVASIEDVFKAADFISLHIPLIESTRNLVAEGLLSLMKPSSYLINTARGGIIDEKVLAAKLRDRKIAGAALDVFEKEPLDASNELLGLDNIILTPHSAALTKECTVRVALAAVEGVVDHIQGRTPKFVYNKEVLP